MKQIVINGINYSYNCVYAQKRSINGNIGVTIQLQVFREGIQIEKNDFCGYVEECICRNIRDSFND